MVDSTNRGRDAERLGLDSNPKDIGVQWAASGTAEHGAPPRPLGETQPQRSFTEFCKWQTIGAWRIVCGVRKWWDGAVGQSHQPWSAQPLSQKAGNVGLLMILVLFGFFALPVMILLAIVMATMAYALAFLLLWRIGSAVDDLRGRLAERKGG